MCVRYFIRRRCQNSKKFKTKSRHSGGRKVLCRSTSRESRFQTLRLEAADLFCPEFLPILDSQKCHAAADVSNLPKDDLRDLSVTIQTTAAAFNGPSTLCTHTRFADSPSHHLHSESWHDMEQQSQIQSLDPGAADTIEARSIADDLVCHHSYSDQGSNELNELGAGKGSTVPGQIEKAAETCTFLGNSRQSKFLPREGWPIQPRGPFGSQSKERKCYYPRQSCSLLPSIIGTESLLQARGDYNCTFKFYEVIGILLERETETCYQLSKSYVQKLTENFKQRFEHNELRAARRRIVKWIFEVVTILHLSSLTAAHAVSILDRYLSHTLFPGPQDAAHTDIRLVASACIWIAAKLEDSNAPDLSSIRGLSSFEYDEEKIREMEVSVLKSLGWRMIAATACDFLANMVAQLPALGLPSHLLRPVEHRSEEIIQGVLSEVEFLAYQPSVVGNSVMQCLLDEFVPVHTASIMAAFHLALAVHVESEVGCHRTLVDLVVDPDLVCAMPSPDRVGCACSGNVRDGCSQ